MSPKSVKTLQQGEGAGKNKSIIKTGVANKGEKNFGKTLGSERFEASDELVLMDSVSNNYGDKLGDTG